MRLFPRELRLWRNNRARLTRISTTPANHQIITGSTGSPGPKEGTTAQTHAHHLSKTLKVTNVPQIWQL